MENGQVKCDVEYIMDIPITSLSKNACLEKIRKSISDGKSRCIVVCANPHSLEVARSDQVFRKALLAADLVIPDGFGVVMASRLLGGRIRERITGSDIFLELCQIMNKERGRSVFFLGSTGETLAKIKHKFVSNFPAIRMAGTYSPPFRREFYEGENRAMVEAVNDARPDVLWIGMTAPKQEKWIYANRERLRVPFIGAIGAVFDFYAGTKKRSSIFWQRLGLEWFPRFLREPKRLWERNLKSTPVFLYWLARERIRNNPPPF